MANKPVKMHLIRRLIQLMERGYSERSMVKELSISRPTIRNYKNRLEASGEDYLTLKSLSDEQLSNLVYPSVDPAVNSDARRLDIESRMDYLSTMDVIGPVKTAISGHSKRESLGQRTEAIGPQLKAVGRRSLGQNV